MTTLLQKIYRNIGSRQLFTWQDGYFNYGGSTRVAVIVGGTSRATFNASATVDGYATLDMTLGTSPGVTDGYSVSLFGTSLNNLVNEINAAWAAHNSYFSTNPPATSGENGILIINPYYIKINAYSDRDHFEAIGLPQDVIRNIALAPHSDGYIDHKVAITRTDTISDSIAIPDGANILTLWATLFSHTNDDNMTISPGLIPLWSNGVEGEPVDNFILSFPWSARIVDGYWNSSTQNMLVDDQIITPIIKLLPNYAMITSAEIQYTQPPIEVHIPAGTTSVRIAMTSPNFLTLSQVPTIPQSYRIAITFAAR